MPRYIIERNFAEQVDLDSAGVKLIEEANMDASVKWIFSFLSADKRKTYCLYEAPNADALREAARNANMPADTIVEVDQISAGMFV